MKVLRRIAAVVAVLAMAAGPLRARAEATGDTGDQPAAQPGPATAATPAAPAPRAVGNEAQKTRARILILSQERRKVHTQILAKESALAKNNTEVQTKLKDIEARSAQLRQELLALTKERTEVFRAADAELANLYERRDEMALELSELRQSSRNVVAPQRPWTPRPTRAPARPRVTVKPGPTIGPPPPPAPAATK